MWKKYSVPVVEFSHSVKNKIKCPILGHSDLWSHHWYLRSLSRNIICISYILPLHNYIISSLLAYPNIFSVYTHVLEIISYQHIVHDCFSIAVQHSIVGIRRHLLTQLPTDGHLDCLQLFAMSNMTYWESLYIHLYACFQIKFLGIEFLTQSLYAF